MRSWNRRFAVLSVTTLSVATAIACSSSSSDSSGDDTTDAGGIDATVLDSSPVTDSGSLDSGVDAEVPCTATPCVRQVAVAGAFSCALLDDRSVRCWGDNTNAQLGSGTLDAGVVTPETLIPPIAVPGITDAISISGTGTYYNTLNSMCAVLSGGGVKCWGANNYGQLGTGVFGPIPSIGPTTSNVLHAVTVSGGFAHVCVVTDDAGISCWGSNDSAETGHVLPDGGHLDPNPTQADFGAAVSFVQVSGGLAHTCAVTIDGHVWCWGYDAYGQLGRASTDGGAQDQVPAQVAGLTDVKQVACGYFATCAVTNAGVIQCWGLESNGQLGRNDDVDASTMGVVPMPAPIAAPAGVTFTQVVSTVIGFAGLASDGTVWTWGNNQFGQLGHGMVDDAGAVTPKLVTMATKVAGVADVTQLAGASVAAHTCARIKDGSVKCWGYNASSQVGVAPVDAGLPQFTPVTVAF